MAIVNSLEGGYFVLDTPDVRWPVASTGRTVTVSITPLNGPTSTFSERYTPDGDGSVVLRGLSGLLQSYCFPCPTSLRNDLLTSGGVWLATLSRCQWTAVLTDSEGAQVGDTLTSYAYYSSQRTNTLPGSAAIWLSRYTNREVVPQQPLLASFMLTTGLSARLRIRYMDNGSMHETVYTPTISGTPEAVPTQAAVLHYRLSDIATAASIEADSIYQVDFELLNGENLADTLRYRIDRSNKKLLRIVAFTNCYGMLETEAFTGSENSKTEMEGEYSYIDDVYSKISQSLIQTSRMAAGNVTDERHCSLRDLVTSPEVRMVYDADGTCFDQVTVTDLEMEDRRPRTAFQTAYVTFRPSHRHQEVVSRGPSTSPETQDGVFDHTFDDSFN